MRNNIGRETPAAQTRRPKVFAISSGGGHWVQLLRLRPAWEDCDVLYVTVSEGYRASIGEARFATVNDATRWDRVAVLKLALRVLYLLVRERPDVVVTTGAAPGYFAIRFGRLVGARTCWIDSIANVEELSLSGRKAGAVCDLWLTQWSHLAPSSTGERGPRYAGAVI
ncbi:MAG: hypothetical protein U0572_16735 [Phycisphaerales bacterium]